MNRPTIKKILNDAALSESEKIDQIFAVYTASTSKLKTEEDMQKAVENAQKGLNVKETEPYKALEKELVDLKSTNDEALKAKDKELSDFKASVEADKAADTTRQALRRQLAADGANPKLIPLLEKEFDLATLVTEGEAGKETIKDWETVRKPVKESYADVFTVAGASGTPPATPPSGGGGGTNYVAQLEDARKSGNTQDAVRIKTEAAKDGVFLI